MKIISPSFEILTDVNGEEMLRFIERIGRVCYKSEDRITRDSSRAFVKAIIKSGHESVLEHAVITVRFICDRGVSHEIVRHRIASYSQESTRYCNYSCDNFGNELTFIRPYFWKYGTQEYSRWSHEMQNIETLYMQLMRTGNKPQEARAILPNSLKTELVMTANLREWRHFLRLRTASDAHPQMREIAIPLLEEFKKLVPVVFDDVSCDR